MIVLKDRAQTSNHLPRKIVGYADARTLQVSPIEYSTRLDAWGDLQRKNEDGSWHGYYLELLTVEDLLVYSSVDDIPADIIDLIEWE